MRGRKNEGIERKNREVLESGEVGKGRRKLIDIDT